MENMEVKIRIIEERLDRAYDIDDLPMIEMLESRLAVVRAANGNEKRKNGKEKSA